MKPWELGHKKMSRNKNKTVGGHTGCSEGNISQLVQWLGLTLPFFVGYNYRNYQSNLAGLQSQGREQVHSQLEKISCSLRQCSFQLYMILLKTLDC